MGGPNQSLANKLGISEEKPYFTNPVSGEKVYWFYDAPHLLKLLRNHILDSKGLKLKCGKTIDKSVFEKILRADSQDFKICYKLTQKHISLNNREKQRVCYAAQLLSRTTSLAIESLDPNNKEISEFVALVNDWFDVFNSRHPNDPIRKPFGMDLENQTAILDRMSDEIRHLRKGDKRAMLPFQRGILISINSLKALFNDLSTGPLKMRYTITRAYNQDKLENCFGMIRAVGRYHDCPNAYEAQCRLKTVMLGWNYRENTRSVSANIEDSAPTTFLSSLLLSSLNKNSTGCTEDGSCDDDVQDPDVENNQLDEDELPSEENWNEFYGKLNSSEKCEFGGKEYVCGFIARKLKKKFPQLSLGHTSSVTRMPQSWVQRKSRGNLTVPTYDWLAMCSKLDKVFVQHHDLPGPVKVNQNPGAIRGLRRKLEKRFPEIPPQAIRLFVRTRTFIRIKHVNHNIVANRFSRNKKGAQFAKSSMNLRNQSRTNEGFSILNFDDEEMSTTCRGI
ncbi:unnamed protein product [Orchesella dallaii]|uniref:Transposable element P transposase-like GTP-binding insertion domain-containing protein n=1 Tax=Orchesella dallaii TaxID=48710 RepID=A0ABP1Q2R6_9HEXA